MYLIDTDVVSGAFPGSTRNGIVRSFLDRHWLQSYVSVVTVAEIRSGVERLRLRGATRKAEALDGWARDLEATYKGRLVPVGLDVARRSGALMARADLAGHDPGFADACIAATADTLGYEVVTFNARHFAAFGVPHRSPLSEAADDPA